MPTIAARMVAELFGHDTTKEAPRPEWAEGLATKEDLRELIEAAIPPAVRTTIESLRESDPRLLDVPAPDTQDSPR